SITTSSVLSQILALEYINNSNWIAKSKEGLECILKVANKFYSIIKAAINKYKP
ncbi:17727_t:CDS:1, partial [Funneliformis geosporum]